MFHVTRSETLTFTIILFSTMVYYEQRFLLPEVQSRIEALIHAIGILAQKLPDLSEPLDPTAVIDFLQKVQRIGKDLRHNLANVESVLDRVDGLIGTVDRVGMYIA
jgi:hypothetical protein